MRRLRNISGEVQQGVDTGLPDIGEISVAVGGVFPCSDVTGERLVEGFTGLFETVFTPGGGTGGAVDSVNGKVGAVVLNQDEILDGPEYKRTHNDYSDADNAKLDGIEENAEENNISDVNAASLTSGGDNSLHSHSYDRDRLNHTGVQGIATITGLSAQLGLKVNISDIIDNVTSSDIDRPLSANQGRALKAMIDALNGTLIPQGNWNADTNTPDISGTTTTGFYWIVSVAGSVDVGGISDWEVNDWVIKTATGWAKVDNTDKVLSVNGQTGAIVLDTSNISDSVDRRYMTDAQEANLDNQTNTNTGDETDATIKTKYENNVDTNAFTDAEKASVANAVHVNVAGEIAGITEKVTPIITDKIIIEDSENGNAKRMIEIGNLPQDGGEAGDGRVEGGEGDMPVSSNTLSVNLGFRPKKINLIIHTSLDGVTNKIGATDAVIIDNNDYTTWISGASQSAPYTRADAGEGINIWAYAYNLGGITMEYKVEITDTGFDIIEQNGGTDVFKFGYTVTEGGGIVSEMGPGGGDTIFVSESVTNMATIEEFTHNLNVTQSDVEAGRYSVVNMYNDGTRAIVCPTIVDYGAEEDAFQSHGRSSADPISGTSGVYNWQENTLKVRKTRSGTVSDYKIAIKDNRKMAVNGTSQTKFLSGVIAPDTTTTTFTHNLKITQSDVEAGRYSVKCMYEQSGLFVVSNTFIASTEDNGIFNYRDGTASTGQPRLHWQENTLNMYTSGVINKRIAIIDNRDTSDAVGQGAQSSGAGNFVVPVNGADFSAPISYAGFIGPIIGEDKGFVITRNNNSPYQVYKNNSLGGVDYKAGVKQEINGSNSNYKLPIVNGFIYAILADEFMYKISVDSDISILGNRTQLYDSAGKGYFRGHNGTNLVYYNGSNVQEVDEAGIQQSTADTGLTIFNYCGLVVGNSTEFLFYHHTTPYMIYSMRYGNVTKTELAYIGNTSYLHSLERGGIIYKKGLHTEDFTYSPIYKLA